jgi:peroxiredoxin Q/BCP
MFSTRRARVASVALLLATASAAFAQMPAVGAAAPAFTLPSQEGNNVNLSDYKGKWVVLYFYPKDFTSGCTIQAKNFERDHAKYTAKNAAILGVSVDSVDSHKEFCTKESLTFKLLADTKGDVVAKYGSSRGAMAARNTFLIDPKGNVAKVYTGVMVNQHSEEVLAALAELQK